MPSGFEGVSCSSLYFLSLGYKYQNSCEPTVSIKKVLSQVIQKPVNANLRLEVKQS